jgi:hypothetical protein
MGESLLIGSLSKVLTSLPAMKMKFWAHKMHITGGGYQMVFVYIAQGWIKPRLVRLASQIADGAEAEYKPDSHTLWFRRDTYGTRPDERASIVHECTHALRDIMASSAFAKDGMYGSSIGGQQHFDNEAAAYIAGSLFYMYDNNGAEWPFGGDAEITEVYRAANAIARGLKDKDDARVDETAFADLKAKISLVPEYANIALPNAPDDIGHW